MVRIHPLPAGEAASGDFSAVIGGACGGCGVSNPLLTYSVNVQAGKAYTSYIIGNPWSNLYQVFTLED